LNILATIAEHKAGFRSPGAPALRLASHAVVARWRDTASTPNRPTQPSGSTSTAAIDPKIIAAQASSASVGPWRTPTQQRAFELLGINPDRTQ
jgi:hypothetical protein